MRRRNVVALAGVAAFMLLALAGCAAPAGDVAPPDGASLPGFWWGLWHGAILPIAFVVSLFDSTVGVYAVRHAGHAYDAGFVIGVWVFLGGGFTASRTTIPPTGHR